MITKYITLLRKEIKDLFFSKATLLFYMIMISLLSYSFYSAVLLYSEASKSAIDNNPLYASGFEPIIGVFTPTFGGFFLSFSLFLPFIFIRIFSIEKSNKTLDLLLQLPFNLFQIVLAKVLAGILFLIFTLSFIVPALIIWEFWGGHIAYSELILLLLGYLLYGIVILAISIFSSIVTKNIGSASILAIFIIILSWFIDFGKDMNISAVLIYLSDWTLTHSLKTFEEGIFSFQIIIYLISISTLFILISYILLKYDITKKLRSFFISLSVLSFFVVIFFTSFFNKTNFDLTESHRNSFSPNIIQILNREKLSKEIEIAVYLRRTDSRFIDYEKTFLKKLQLVKGNVELKMMQGEDLENNYGLFKYKIKDIQRVDSTYSNSEVEIFQLLFNLAGIEKLKKDNSSFYKGYPLVIEEEKVFNVIYIYFILAMTLLLFSQNILIVMI